MSNANAAEASHPQLSHIPGLLSGKFPWKNNKGIFGWDFEELESS